MEPNGAGEDPTPPPAKKVKGSKSYCRYQKEWQSCGMISSPKGPMYNKYNNYMPVVSAAVGYQYST